MSIDDLLAMLVQVRGSDLHLKVGSPPVLRIDGELHPTDLAPLTAADMEAYARGLLTPRAAEEFQEVNEADFAYGTGSMGRFRVNAFRQRGSAGLVIRRVLPGSKNFEELGLPPVLSTLTDHQRGLVLVTGPTGSGKTTTLASMVDYINSNRRVNIVTIEDPIEVLHPDKLSIVSQRELGIDTGSFAEALRRVLRQDPDVILIGEMRDAETVRAALKASETGHLVLSSLHTIDATETVNRIVDFFPPYQERQIRLLLGGSLRGVVSLRLLERVDGQGRVPAVEVLTMNGRVFDRIVHEGQTHTLVDVIREGDFYGMQTFDQSIFHLYERGLISFRVAAANASNPHDFRLKVQQAGLRSA
ncbi:MAG: PilT/PilU family type 4a pilus ATPase [Actinomycetota bacterium]|nr:PilT/PilU family type 4a pilus ATPase [Actinomycetota bacterium]